MTEIARDDADPVESLNVRAEWPHVLILGTVLVLLFSACVFGYARYAGAWVGTLDDRSGEIVALRAESAGKAGRLEDAIALYEDALRLGFQTPDQYVWVRQKYVPVLLEAEKFDRAAAVAEEVLASGVQEIGDWVGRQAFSKIHAAVSARGDHNTAAALAGRWTEAGKRCGNVVAQSQGMFLKGVSLRALGETAEAKAAFQSVSALSPTPEMQSAVDREMQRTGQQQ